MTQQRSRDVALSFGQELDDFGALVNTPRQTGESDNDYRARLIMDKNQTVATMRALYNNLIAVANVDKIRIYDPTNTKQNITNMQDGRIIIAVRPIKNEEGESLLDVKTFAQAILDTRAAGVNSFSVQNNYVALIDPEGFLVKEGFDFVTEKYLNIQAVLTPVDVNTETQLTENIKNNVFKELQTYLEKIGQDVTITDIDDIIGYLVRRTKSKSIEIAVSGVPNDPDKIFSTDDYIADQADFINLESLTLLYNGQTVRIPKR